MHTELLSVAELPRAIDLMKRGEIVAFPTETVYGLGASFFNEEAISKIFTAKGRPSDNPLIAHVYDLEGLQRIAQQLPALLAPLIEAFWPGPLTVVLRRQEGVSSLASAGLETVAVRMPSHLVARELIRLLGEPIVAPSANLSGRPSSTRASHVMDDFKGKIAAVIEGGSCEWGVESTVISLVDEPMILRPGALTQEQIEAVLGKKMKRYVKGGDEKVASPGMKYRHYAPKARVRLFNDEKSLRQELNSSRQQMVLARVGVMGEKALELSLYNLFAQLRAADERGIEEILVLCDGEVAQNAALMDRLSKSAEG